MEIRVTRHVEDFHLRIDKLQMVCQLRASQLCAFRTALWKFARKLRNTQPTAVVGRRWTPVNAD